MLWAYAMGGILMGAVGRCGKVAARLAIEKDWTKALVLNNQDALALLNSCKMFIGRWYWLGP